MVCNIILAETQKNLPNSCNLFNVYGGGELNNIKPVISWVPIKEKYYSNSNNLGIWKNQEGGEQQSQEGTDICENRSESIGRSAFPALG